jgi:hypothetical protein
MTAFKVSSVISALTSHNGAMRLDALLTALSVPATPDNLHDFIDWAQDLANRWTDPDEDARAPVPASGHCFAVASTKSQRRWGLDVSAYQVDGNYVPLADRPRKARKPAEERVTAPQARWMPVVLLCLQSDLLDPVPSASCLEQAASTMAALPESAKFAFGELKSAKPSRPGYVLAQIEIKVA